MPMIGPTWVYCKYCGYKTTSPLDLLEHERSCPMNPANKPVTPTTITPTPYTLTPSPSVYIRPPTVSVRPEETYQAPTIRRTAIDPSLLILGGIALLALIVLMKK